jgi:hypothetical protein
MKQDPYWEPVSIKHHNTKFSSLGNMVARICAPNILEFLKIMNMKNTWFLNTQAQIPQQCLTVRNTFLDFEKSESALLTLQTVITICACFT